MAGLLKGMFMGCMAALVLWSGIFIFLNVAFGDDRTGVTIEDSKGGHDYFSIEIDPPPFPDSPRGPDYYENKGGGDIREFMQEMEDTKDLSFDEYMHHRYPDSWPSK